MAENLSPNGVGTETNAPSTTPLPAPPAASPITTPPPPPAGSPSQASTGLLGGEPTGAFSVREALQAQGIQLPEGVDERAAIQQLVQAYQQTQQLQAQLQQANHLAQYGQMYVQHADQFNTWLRQHQEQQRQQQQTQKDAPWWNKWWDPPEYNAAWERLLERDTATGQLRAVSGADPSILPKYQAYEQYRRQQIERLASNPFEYFQEPIQHLARQISQEVVQNHLTQYQDNLFSDQFVQQNASWLVKKDAQGRPLAAGRDPQTGRSIPDLTAEGQAFANFVIQAERIGIRDVRAQKDYATAMLERELALYQLQQAQNGQAGQQQKQNFLNQAAGANHVPGQSGSLQYAQNVNAPAQNQGTSLADRMRLAFKEAGIPLDAELQPA